MITKNRGQRNINYFLDQPGWESLSETGSAGPARQRLAAALPNGGPKKSPNLLGLRVREVRLIYRSWSAITIGHIYPFVLLSK